MIFLIPDNPAMFYRGPDFPRSREFLSQILCILLHHNMSVKQAHFVADNISIFMGSLMLHEGSLTDDLLLKMMLMSEA